MTQLRYLLIGLKTSVKGNSREKFILINKNAPVEFFETFFDAVVLLVFEYVAIETNRFAEAFFHENVLNFPENPRALKLFDTNAIKLKVFVGFIILQSVNKARTCPKPEFDLKL